MMEGVHMSGIGTRKCHVTCLYSCPSLTGMFSLLQKYRLAKYYPESDGKGDDEDEDRGGCGIVIARVT